jgi:hypothetical protein
MPKSKMVLLVNIPSMNDLPASERWLLKDHAMETLSWIGPYLDEYVSYRVVPPPPDMYGDVVRHGYYNWRVTNHVYNEPTPPPSQLWTIVAPLPHPARREATEVEQIYSTKATGSKAAPLMHVLCFVPLVPTEDFKGRDLDPLKTNILRWVTVHKYPEGVPVEEGEKWYLDTHSKEVLEQPGLIRYYSFRTLAYPGHPPYPWHRVSELWYEDFNSWKRAVVDTPPAYTPPPWAQYDRYPFFEPYMDFASAFILERPTNDFLRDYTGYFIHV